MDSPADIRRAIRIAQRVLTIMVGTNLRVDGVAGPKTQLAWAEAPPVARAVITAVFSELVSGAAANFLEAHKSGTVVDLAKGPLTRTELASVISQARRRLPTSIKTRTDWLSDGEILDKIQIESGGDPKAISRNGQFRGLLQLGEAAWKDAMAANRQLPPYAPAVFDPISNVEAGLSYWAALITQLRARDITTFNSDVIYAAHQQGAGGFSKLVKSNATPDQIRKAKTGIDVVDNQSKPSLAIVARAVEAVRVA